MEFLVWLGRLGVSDLICKVWFLKVHPLDRNILMGHSSVAHFSKNGLAHSLSGITTLWTLISFEILRAENKNFVNGLRNKNAKGKIYIINNYRLFQKINKTRSRICLRTTLGGELRVNAKRHNP